MKITDFRSEIRGQRTRIAANVAWEDCDRPTQDVFFETDTRLVGEWQCRPEAFLVACLLPAWRHRESRIALNAPLCPTLQYNLEAAIGLLNQWYPGRKAVCIEAKERVSRESNPSRVAGLVLSGGIDSLCLLRVNRRTYPANHPRAFQMGVFVHGFDIGYEADCPRHDLYALAREALEPICRDCHLELVPLTTNVRHLDPEGAFWGEQFHSAALASVGHALGHRFHSLSIASGDNREMLPWGSHPALDPLYSSLDMQVLHDGVQYTRLEKTAIVADWQTALDHLRVCYEATSAPLNCGKCEKCLRTMLHLLVCGKLADCAAFPVRDVTPAMLKPLRAISVNQEAYETLTEPLKAMGRHDLAKITRDLKRVPQAKWVGAAQARIFAVRADRRLCGGKMARLRNSLRERANPSTPLAEQNRC